MKIQLVSDLHLEFGPISIKNAGDTDVLILSGDICLASDLDDRDAFEVRSDKRSQIWHTFFQECAARFPHVIYIMGNHEHYHGDYAKTYSRLKEKLSYLKNLYILEKEVKEIDGVMFIGGTLWTDMNKEDPLTLASIKSKMNDYISVDDSSSVVNYKAYIQKDKPVGITDEEWLNLPYEQRVRTEFKTRPGRLIPDTTLAAHKAMVEFIATTVSNQPLDKKVVVVGHHAPTKLSINPRYERNVVVNGAYSSDLTNLMLDNPQIKLWTHGHTHDTFDYMIGSTRVVCNPRGYYGHEENNSFDMKKVIEI